MADANDSQWTTPEHFVRYLLSRTGHSGTEALELETLTLPFHLLEHLLLGHSESVFLKQFRDASEPDRGCFRHVITAPMQVTRLQGGLSSTPFRLTIEQLDSHPILNELGISSQIEAYESFELDMDFILGANDTTDGPVPAGGVEGRVAQAVRTRLSGRLENAAVKLAPLAAAARIGLGRARGAVPEARVHTARARDRLRPGGRDGGATRS